MCYDSDILLCIQDAQSSTQGGASLTVCMQMPGGECGFVLIDFEHAGMAGAVPPFSPLRHWPAECRQHGAAYTTAADVYCVGALVRRSGIALSVLADSFSQLMTDVDPAKRPSASVALAHPWLAGA